jgi:hypothetical protein
MRDARWMCYLSAKTIKCSKLMKGWTGYSSEPDSSLNNKWMFSHNNWIRTLFSFHLSAKCFYRLNESGQKEKIMKLLSRNLVQLNSWQTVLVLFLWQKEYMRQRAINNIVSKMLTGDEWLQNASWGKEELIKESLAWITFKD